MAEIYRHSTTATVTFDINGATPTLAVFRRGDVEVSVYPDSPTVTVPYDITRFDGKFTVEWTYTVNNQGYTKTDVHEVVSPLFNKAQLVEWDHDFAMLDDAAVVRLESIIRTVIEAHTGQKFNFEYDTVVVAGNDANKVSLPKRLVMASKLNDRTGDLLDASVKRANDGWTLITSTDSSWVDNFYGSNPIQNPWRKYGNFKSGENYALTGYFGYESVPEDVLKAARILAEDYGCDESVWRDRYITNIRAADWRFEFSGKTWTGTGNVKADKLLEKYTLSRMVVL